MLLKKAKQYDRTVPLSVDIYSFFQKVKKLFLTKSKISPKVFSGSEESEKRLWKEMGVNSYLRTVKKRR